MFLSVHEFCDNGKWKILQNEVRVLGQLLYLYKFLCRKSKHKLLQEEIFESSISVASEFYSV
jgi:hypothetical protein